MIAMHCNRYAKPHGVVGKAVARNSANGFGARTWRPGGPRTRGTAPRPPVWVFSYIGTRRVAANQRPARLDRRIYSPGRILPGRAPVV